MLSKYNADAIKATEMAEEKYKARYIAIDNNGVVAIATWSRKYNQIKFRFEVGGKSMFRNESMFYPTKMADVTGEEFFSDSSLKNWNSYTDFIHEFFTIKGMNLCHD